MVHTVPAFVSRPFRGTVDEGDTVKLPCYVDKLGKNIACFPLKYPRKKNWFFQKNIALQWGVGILKIVHHESQKKYAKNSAVRNNIPNSLIQCIV